MLVVFNAIRAALSIFILFLLGGSVLCCDKRKPLWSCRFEVERRASAASQHGPDPMLEGDAGQLPGAPCDSISRCRRRAHRVNSQTRHINHRFVTQQLVSSFLAAISPDRRHIKGVNEVLQLLADQRNVLRRRRRGRQPTAANHVIPA